MSSVMPRESSVSSAAVGSRSDALAERLEQGVEALIALAAGLSDTAWRTRVPHDGRPIGVIVHHVASALPVEIHLAQVLASGQPVTGVVWDTVHQMNAAHAAENAGVTKQAAIELLQTNAKAAAEAIRAFGDKDLDSAAPASLYDDAPVTCQFMLEDHAVRHSYHHFAVIQQTLKAAGL
jgi:hypothetical protein